jgi:hypothetical protein
MEWLDQHDFPYWDLCFMRDKAAVGADLYIEDSVSNVSALRGAGKDVIVATSQNEELGSDRARGLAGGRRIECVGRSRPGACDVTRPVRP